MLVNHSGSINSDENVRGCLNELEDTATSSRSSFADLWDSTNVEVSREIVFIKINTNHGPWRKIR